MFKTLKLLVLTWFILMNVQAQDLCVHPQICNLVERISPGQKASLAFNIVGDHHHFEPSTDAIKKLISSKNLFHGPVSLHPWLKTVIRQRNLNSNVTNIGFEIDKKLYQTYPHSTDEVLAHFWLYPEMNCLAEVNYKKLIKKDSASIVDNECLEDYKKSTEQLKIVITKLNLPIVLTHDAFLPLLQKLGAKTITLKGSHHHEEIDIKAVKTLYQETKNKKVLWIFEKGFSVPANILKLVKKSDWQIEINTDGELGQNRTAVLDALTEKLAHIKK